MQVLSEAQVLEEGGAPSFSGPTRRRDRLVLRVPPPTAVVQAEIDALLAALAAEKARKRERREMDSSHAHTPSEKDVKAKNDDERNSSSSVLSRPYGVRSSSAGSEDLSVSYVSASEREADMAVNLSVGSDVAEEVVEKAEKGQLRLEISISTALADAFGLAPYSRVLIQAVPAQYVEANFVELIFRKQFLQRGNIWRFNKSMLGRTVHVGQSVTIDGVQATVQEITCRGVAARSGAVLEATQMIFRSRSTRIIWLVQISSEMWDMDHQGDLYVLILGSYLEGYLSIVPYH